MAKNKNTPKRESKKFSKQELEDIQNYELENETERTDIKLDKVKFKKIFKNKKQKELYNKIVDNRVVFIRGSAGTGKTIISLMAALDCIINKKVNINKISLTKPIIEVSKSLGALPGDEKDKTSIHFIHFYDNIEKILGKTTSDKLRDSGLVTETILNYVRGATFGSYDSKGYWLCVHIR